MDMEVLVDVHMIESQSGAGKCGELRPDFRFQLAARRGLEKESDALANHVAVHSPGWIGYFGDQLRVERRPAIGEYNMQTHAQVWQQTRTPDGVLGRMSRDHETGLRSRFRRGSPVS